MRIGKWVVILGLLLTSPALAGEPSASDLISLVPVIQSVDPAVHSLEMAGAMTIKDAGLVRFRALYKAPNHHSILISDPTDGTPLVYVADRQLLFYDPIRSSVSLLKNCSERLTLDGDGKSPRFSFEVGRPGKNGLEGDLLKLDGRSLFATRGTADQRVVNEGEGRYRLISTRSERTVVGLFDVTKAQPFESLKVFEKSSHEPTLSVDRFVVDGPLSKADFPFPDREHLSKKIKVRELAGDFLAPGAEMTLLLKSIQTRHTLKHPGLRDDSPPPGFAHQTWKTLQKNDKTASRVLRELMPFDRKVVAAGVSGSVSK